MSINKQEEEENTEKKAELENNNNNSDYEKKYEPDTIENEHMNISMEYT